MPSLHSNRGAKRAREARAALGYTHAGPLPDLLDAVEGGGGLHVVLLELGADVAGAYIAKPGCPLVFVNGLHVLVRQRFTLAHEFGHHRMGHETVVDNLIVLGGEERDPTEVEANAFAAEFLMPRDAVAVWGVEHVRGRVTLEHVLLLAAEYGVSAQAARYALETAKVLRERGLCDQLDAEIEEGLHVDLWHQLGLEPIEDRLAEEAERLPRVPPALEGSALGDLLIGALDVDGLADRIGDDVAEVRRMLTRLGLDRLLPAAF